MQQMQQMQNMQQPGASTAAPVKPAEATSSSTDTTLVQQKQDVNTNIPQAVLDLEQKNKKTIVEKPKEQSLLQQQQPALNPFYQQQYPMHMQMPPVAFNPWMMPHP